ncbi:hypothetical protein [Leadbetterella sp. DM7]|uniref:hypothetical protein n=1 Tax=Leadbetterella sp. DM7 TaxID=3235085 RepID=UPI00349E8924
MQTVQSHSNFKVQSNLWGSAGASDIVAILDGILSEFYVHLDRAKIPSKQVHITSSFSKTPPTDFPDIFNTKAFAFIYLTAKDRNWSLYVYELAHQLCHLIIDSDSYNKQHPFAWVEECLCELASWFVIHEMNIGWQIFPPNDETQEFAQSLKEYADNTFPLQEFDSQKPFSKWIGDNLPELSKSRYLRHKNVIVAAHLFPLFINQTSLWTAVQYLNQVTVSDETTLEHFLYQWKDVLPTELQDSFNEVIKLFCVKEEKS